MREKGFTLIELVIVIVILGVLSAFALPRFADLSSSAQEASIEAVGGAIATSIQLARVQIQLQRPPLGAPSQIDYDGDGNDDIGVHDGWPQQNWNQALSFLLEGDFTQTNSTSTCTINSFCVIDQQRPTGLPASVPVNATIFFPQGRAMNDQCFAYYNYQLAADGGGSAMYGVVTTGC